MKDLCLVLQTACGCRRELSVSKWPYEYNVLLPDRSLEFVGDGGLDSIAKFPLRRRRFVYDRDIGENTRLYIEQLD